MDKKILKKCKLFLTKNKDIDADSLLNDYRDYASYLMKEHHYTKKALTFYLSDLDFDYENLKRFINKLYNPA